MPRLTQEQHEEIYDLKGKASAHELATGYSVSLTTIYNIWKGIPPRTYKQALHRIRMQLEMTRGLRMSTPVFNMWGNISRILAEVLGEY